MIHGAMQPFALTLDKFIDHAAKWHPDAEVVTACGEGGVDRIGYAALRARAQRVSGVLVDLGVASGEHVATLAWNTQAHVEAWYAIMGMGAVCHTLNPRLMASQLAAMLVQSQARVLIASADLAPLVQQVLAQAPRVVHVLMIDGAATVQPLQRGCSIAALKPAIAAARTDVVWGDFDETAPSGLCFTSGTTGAPKGVTYSHRSSYLHTLRLLQADVMGLTAADAVLAVVPMFHANAWGLPFAAPAVGARLVLPGRHADGERLARLIRDEGVTVAVGVPTVWLGLLEHLEATGSAVPSLRRILVGGAPMPPALMERLEQRLGVTVQTSWGMTELSPLGTAASPADPGRDASLSGRPAVGVDLLLTDSGGRALPEQRGLEGHLKVRGAAVVERYFGDSENATDDGWFDTGDLARIDARGNVTITGRAKDLIKSGGEWINPAEIEAIIAALPQVALVAVIGRADPKWGERPILVAEMRGDDPIADDDLLGALRGRVAPWWIPDAVVRIPNMPLASTGKIDKMRLRSEYGRG
ncbi:fatty-acyl-CoA synthase [Hephaestia caeni]|uniref:Fatty-acyl-CoA synthase n=1 Tax=Hephaestia caeni TaxID=645617 RepID=A0A397PD68_9SPHN|nr:AMP-binding protein [Hephaestia caeni]RIA46982.1 fatty-acyl-CoA synthase [Hephaestia caeni]